MDVQIIPWKREVPGENGRADERDVHLVPERSRSDHGQQLVDRHGAQLEVGLRRSVGQVVAARREEAGGPYAEAPGIRVVRADLVQLTHL